ncbi:MAG: hypothetical protein ACR2RF_27350 [Geminicoccaceae bacterium]
MRRAWVAGIARVAGIGCCTGIARVARRNRIDGSAGILAETLDGVATGQGNRTTQNEGRGGQRANGGAGKKSTVLFTHFLIPPRDT